MKTYQDLLECGENAADKANFIKDVIADHQGSEMYRTGEEAGMFYRHRDPLLEKVKKTYYDREGNSYEDTVSANHKIVANWFYLLTAQTISYLLGNGIIFDDENVKKSLSGNGDIDSEIQQVLTYAICDGEGYGYVSQDGITPMCYACRTEGNEPLFAPLNDEKTGDLSAGVRYWQLTPDTPMQATLYEPDGFTEYEKDSDKEIYIPKGAKQTYNSVTYRNRIQGNYKTETSDKTKLPIVKMRYINGLSAISGNVPLLFAYDVIMSGLVNKNDMNMIYWIIDNADGMSQQDDINFVADLIKTHIAHMRDGITLRKEEIQIDTSGFQNVLEELKRLIFLNFMGVDIDRISAGTVTATEIKASYTNIDLKCDQVERYVIEFIKNVLELRGFDRNTPFHFTRNKIFNEAEEVQTAIQLAPLIGEKAARRFALTAKGKIDEIPIIEQEIAENEMMRFSGEMNNEQTDVQAQSAQGGGGNQRNDRNNQK